MVTISKLEKTNDGIHKWLAIFNDGKTTKFGAYGMNDYTLTGDKEARRLYRVRHLKDLNTNDPQRAGYLSYYILWGESTNINTNVKSFNKKFTASF